MEQGGETGSVPREVPLLQSNVVPAPIRPVGTDHVAGAGVFIQDSDPININVFVRKLVDKGKIPNAKSVKLFLLQGAKISAQIRLARTAGKKNIILPYMNTAGIDRCLSESRY